MSKGFLAGATGFMVVGALGLGVICLEKVPTGTVAVQYSMNGGVKDKVLTEGVHIVPPTIKTKDFKIATQQFNLSRDKKEGSKEDDSFMVQTKDGSMNVDFEMSYSFDGEDAPRIAKKYGLKSGEEIVETIIRGKVKTYVSEVTSKYTTMEAHLEKKGEVNGRIQKHLSEKLSDYGVIIESANLSRTQVPKEVEKAIQQRQKTSQENENAKLELEREETRLKKAKIEGERKVVEAENERKANEIKARGLDDRILEQMAIKKWNGELPKSTNGSTPFINIK